MLTYIKFFIRGFKDCDNDNCFAYIKTKSTGQYMRQRHPATIDEANFRGFLYRAKVRVLDFIEKIDL